MTKPENPNVVAATGMGMTSAPETKEDKPMTEKQAAELRELCERKGEPFDAALTQTQAAARIDALSD